MTSEDARVIAWSTDPYQTTEPLHLQYHRLNRRRGRMSGQLRIRMRYQKYATPWFDYLLVSTEEMQDIQVDRAVVIDVAGETACAFRCSRGNTTFTVFVYRGDAVEWSCCCKDRCVCLSSESYHAERWRSNGLGYMVVRNQKRE